MVFFLKHFSFFINESDDDDDDDGGRWQTYAAAQTSLDQSIYMISCVCKGFQTCKNQLRVAKNGNKWDFLQSCQIPPDIRDHQALQPQQREMMQRLEEVSGLMAELRKQPFRPTPTSLFVTKYTALAN